MSALTPVQEFLRQKQNAPKLLQATQSVVFKVSKKLKENIEASNWLNSQYLNEDIIKRLDYFQDGFVGGEYLVKNYTNLDGMRIPIDFELKCYLPDTNHSLYKIISGTASQVFHTSISYFQPEIKGSVTVADFRFRDTSSEIDFVNYVLTNNNWAMPDPIGLESFFEKKRSVFKQMSILRLTALSHTRRTRIYILRGNGRSIDHRQRGVGDGKFVHEVIYRIVMIPQIRRVGVPLRLG